MAKQIASDNNWREVAVELWTEGGIPAKRARVVALVASGRTHAEVAEELHLNHRGEVSTHVSRYRSKDLPNARWLAENGPEI